MIQLSALIALVLSITSVVSGSRSRSSLSLLGDVAKKNKTSQGKTKPDSSNSDTTSSEDSDNWDPAKEPQFDYVKTYEKYEDCILGGERNLEECRKWDMKASIPKEDEIRNHEDYYTPLIIRDDELEDQVNPTRSVMARILAQYRRDLGFNPVGDFYDPEPSLEEANNFFGCFYLSSKKVDPERDERRRIRKENRALKTPTEESIKRAADREIQKADRARRKRRRKFEKLFEAYSFLKFLGKIPQNLEGMECEEIRARSGNFLFQYEIREAYKTEMKFYTLLDWDYLDLSHFEYHNFPIQDQITRNITYPGNAKVISPPVLMPRGLNVLEKYERHLRFHNPRSIEGRKMLLFQRLYRRYHTVMKGESDPYFINWEQCTVLNWPEYIDRGNMNKWTDVDVFLLERLVEDGDIIFEKSSKLLKEQPAPLGMTADFHLRPRIKVEIDKRKGDDCAISDDENICGSAEKIAEIEHKKIEKSSPSPKLAKRKKTSTKNEETSKASMDIVEPFRVVKSIKVVSEELATEEEREEVFAEALEIFRKTSGEKDAEEIDWTLMSVSVLQNHLIPFSTDLTTKGDVQTLAKLMKAKKLSFHNLKICKGRGTKIFEQLYQKCGIDVGFNLDEFIIRWNAVEVIGWPEDIARVCGRWKSHELDIIEPLVRDGKIIFKLNEKYSEMLKTSKEYIQSRGMLIDYNIQTTGPLFGSSEDLKTPSFANAVLSPTNKKRSSNMSMESRDSSDFAEDEPIIVPAKRGGKIKATAKPEEIIVKYGEFSGHSRAEIAEFVFSIDQSITNYTLFLSNSSNNCRRKNRIVLEIISALNLIRRHATCEKLSDIPKVPVDEINEFISLCCDALSAVDSEGNLDESSLRFFVVSSVNLRARLLGAQGSLSRAQIKKGIVFDMEMFGFLVHSDPTAWNIEFLEEFIDNDAMPIFKTAKEKRII